jgi:hypothetical protein
MVGLLTPSFAFRWCSVVFFAVLIEGFEEEDGSFQEPVWTDVTVPDPADRSGNITFKVYLAC